MSTFFTGDGFRSDNSSMKVCLIISSSMDYLRSIMSTHLDVCGCFKVCTSWRFLTFKLDSSSSNVTNLQTPSMNFF